MYVTHVCCSVPFTAHCPVSKLPLLSSRISWKACWTCPTSRWNSSRSNQPTPRKLPTSRGCCRKTWWLLEPRYPACPRWVCVWSGCFTVAFHYVSVFGGTWEMVCSDSQVRRWTLCVFISVRGSGDGPGLGGIQQDGEISRTAEDSVAHTHELQWHSSGEPQCSAAPQTQTSCFNTLCFRYIYVFNYYNICLRFWDLYQNENRYTVRFFKSRSGFLNSLFVLIVIFSRF